MKRVSFLSKLALIFNVLFVIELILVSTQVFKTENKFIPILGASVISPILNLSLLLSLIMIKQPGKPLPVPKWIWALSLFFLIFQVVAFMVK